MGRAIVGLFFLVLAVTATQAVAGVWPAAARNTPAPSGTASDTLLGWGENNDGELGDGTTTNRNTPVNATLSPGTEVTAIAATGDHSVALTSTGTVLAWGDNFDGQLGDGTTTNRNTPVTVDLPPGITITAIAAGDDHSLALTSTGTVLAWGDNSQGQLGDGTTTNRSTPVTVTLPPGITITAIAAGDDHSLALTSTDTLLAWGENNDGELGDGTTTDRSTPVTVDLPPGIAISAVAAHGDHSLALTSADTILAWGANFGGQLGDGTTTSRSTPVTVTLPAGVTITAIAAGDEHSLALTPTGTVLSWGDNSEGQLGDGTTTNRNTPVTVDLPPATIITAIAAGDAHSLALTAPPTSTTTLQVTPANPAADQDTTLTATVTCNVDTPTGTITFRTNTTTLTTTPLTTTTATHTTTLPPGTHTLTAHYTSTNTCPDSQSPPTTITIAPPPDEPDLPITGPNLTTTTGAAALSILAGVILSYAARRRPPHRTT